MLTRHDRGSAGAGTTDSAGAVGPRTGPHRSPDDAGDHAAPGRPHRALHVWAAVGFAGSCGLAAFGTRVGAVPDGVGWWFSLPGGSTTVPGVLFYLCVCLLVAAWVGVGMWGRTARLTTRQGWFLLGAWGIPLALGPPLFSRDLYSYVAQGLIAHSGANPYTAGPSVLGPGPVLESVASVWRHTPTPYGPLFVSLLRGIAAVCGTSITAEVLALRGLELAGVVLIMVFLPRLARNLGADPGLALWLGALSPLALFSFIASGHNDGLMLGLLVAGLALASEERMTAALVLCALAMTVKVPAGAAIIFVGLGWLRATTGRRRLGALVRIVAVPLATVAVVTWASGLGWTWLGPDALRVPTELRVLPTPSVAIGTLFSHLLSLARIHVSRRATITVTEWACSVGALAIGAWLAVRVRRFNEVRLLGCALAVLVLAGPTLWPWYLLWGLTLLAATPAQRSRAVAVVMALAMLVVGPGGSPLLQGNTYLIVVGVCAAGVYWLVRNHRWASVALGPVV